MTTKLFTEQEILLLQEELASRLHELDLEIAHTDRLDFRSMLKQRRNCLSAVMDKLATPDFNAWLVPAAANKASATLE